MYNRRAFHRAALGLLLAPHFACKQRVSDSPHRTLFMLEGPEREERVLAGAREEGRVVVYTSLNTQDSVPVTAAFEQQYGIMTELWRSSSERVVQRAVTEARASRFVCDVLETNGPEMEALSREHVLDEFRSPHFADLAPASLPEHRRYAADRFNFFTIGYNTNLVTPDEVPDTYEDLLHPRFVGRIGLEAGDVDWFGAMVKYMGEEKGRSFFRRLASAKPQMRSGHTLMGQLVASGEIPLAANIYNHNAERLAVSGAPIQWKALVPTFGRPNAVGVARQAAHPHAALLFTDFLLSPEGQTLLKEHNRVPSSRVVDSHLNAFPFEMIDPAITLDEDAKWSALWSEFFLGGEQVPRTVE